MEASTVSVLRAADRYVTESPGVLSTHEFSFGRHYDPARTSFGLLVAHNVETLQPGHGFDAHQHRDIEIVSWVVSGALRHQDSSGHAAVVRPGTLQWLSPGSGVTHAEVNAEDSADAEPVRFVQMWLRGDAFGSDHGEPRYSTVEPAAAELRSSLVELVSGARTAVLVGDLQAGDERELPTAAFIHLHVVRGEIAVAEVSASEGDSVSLTNSTAAQVSAFRDSEVLVVAMDDAGL